MLHSEMEHLNWQTSSSFELGVEYITNIHTYITQIKTSEFMSTYKVCHQFQLTIHCAKLKQHVLNRYLKLCEI